MKLNDLSVLIVDDNPRAIKIIRNVLSGLGVSQISTAKDNKRARAIVAHDVVHLIICDWKWKSAAGLQLLKEVRKTHPNILFIVVTENVDADSVLAAKEAGVDAFIGKPFTANTVEEKLLILARRL